MKRSTVYLAGYDCKVIEVFESKKDALAFIKQKNETAKYKIWEMIGRPFNKAESKGI